MKQTYTDHPTKVRVFFEDDHWAIDAIDDEGNYSEFIWTHYDGVPMTRDEAISHVPEFASEHGLVGAPVQIEGE